MTAAIVLYRSGEIERLTGRSVSAIERKLTTRMNVHVIGWNDGGGGDTYYHALQSKPGTRKLLASLNHSECAL